MASAAEAFGRARRMDANFHTLKAGMRSRKPTGSSASMPGAARPLDSRCVLTRENRGAFLAVYIAKVRITVQADGTTIVREGHGSGEGRGTSPGEAHDTALKAAETDATKRALRLSANRSDLSSIARIKMLPWRACPTLQVYCGRKSADAAALWRTSGRHDANPAAVALLRSAHQAHGRPTPAGSGKSQGMRCGNPSSGPRRS